MTDNKANLISIPPHDISHNGLVHEILGHAALQHIDDPVDVLPLFVSQNETTKSRDWEPILKQVERIVRHNRMGYEDLRYAYRMVRERLNLKPESKPHQLPKIASQAEIARFFDVVDAGPSLCHQVLLRLLFYCGLRNAEVCDLRQDDVDLDGCKIHVRNGKGDKERWILFPEGFGLTLKAYMASTQDNVYLFESSQRKKFTTRRVQQIFKQYREQAGLEDKFTPHLARHCHLTWLTASGMTDQQIRVQSGHSKGSKALAVYQHVAPEALREVFEQAMVGRR